MPCVPVRITQRASRPPSSDVSWSRIAWSSALRFSGWEMVSRTTPSAGSSSRTSPGTERLLEDHERVALADRLALLAEDLLHDALVLGLDRHLHLHRLEDHDRVAL